MDSALRDHNHSLLSGISPPNVALGYCVYKWKKLVPEVTDEKGKGTSTHLNIQTIKMKGVLLLAVVIAVAHASFILPDTEGGSCVADGETYEHHEWILNYSGMEAGKCGHCYCEDTEVRCITHECSVPGGPPVAIP